MSDVITVYSPEGTDTVTVVAQDVLSLSTQTPAQTPIVSVFTQPAVVTVEVIGARGPQGPIGGGTGSGGFYVQNFATASDTWTANHNLGFVPNVGLTDAQGKGIRGHVESNNETTTVVTFYNPVSGRINLS